MFTDGRTDVQNNIIGAANAPKNLPIFKFFIFIDNICNPSVCLSTLILTLFVFINFQLFSSFRFLSSFSSTCIVISICKCLSYFIYPIYSFIFPFCHFFSSSYVSFCVILSAFSTLITRGSITKQVLNNIYFPLS
jgi:hypothetical protein